MAGRGTSRRRRPIALALTLGALGVVFGDIGTSPLYAMQIVFSMPRLAQVKGLECDIDAEHPSSFVSRIGIHVTSRPGMRRSRKMLFVALARNAADR